MISNVVGLSCTKPNTVQVYDSMQSPSLDLATKKVICCITKPNATLTIDFIKLIAQENLDDCGVYALAYATELAAGCDPATAVWDTKGMRQHLIKCFERGEMERFPVQRRRRITLGRRVHCTALEDIHCVCKMPNEEDIPMIMCDCCRKWFHGECVGIDISSHCKKQWHCKECQDDFNN